MVDIASRLCFFIRSRTRLRRWGQTGLFLDSYPFGMVGFLNSGFFCLELSGVEVEGTYDLLQCLV